jgi:uncharacterized protein (TIGR03435 family)
MRLCFLLPVLSLALPIFAQRGLYGPVTTHLKAGAAAPDITFNSLLSAPVSGSWSQSSLTGPVTVLVFYPDTSHNLQTVTMWNALVDKFSGKPVQFVWITGEKESTLRPFLNDHPIKGWVFLDSAGKTGNAYGLELPVAVYIGPDRRILGFTSFPMAEERTIDAALEHRITTTRPDPANIQAFMASNQVLLDAEPQSMAQRMPSPDAHKPNFPPSYTLHVTPASGESPGNYGGDNFRTLQGYTLREAIEDVYGTNRIRVQVPADIDDRKRYDFSMLLPQPAPPEHLDRDKLNTYFQRGIEDHFQLTARHENRLVDVYLVTADPNHKPPPLQSQSDSGMGSIRNSVMASGISQSHFLFETTSESLDPTDLMGPKSLNAIRGFSVDGTADDFCHFFERQLDRPVVNETNLQGEFQFEAKSSDGDKNDFLQHLHDQLGLTITPGQRNVEMLIFSPR